MQPIVEKPPTPKTAGRLTTRQKCPHPHHHSNVTSRVHSGVRRDGAIARSKRGRRRGRADRPLGEFVRSDVWHQSRVNGHSDQSLTDISNDIMEALLENVVHPISRYRACGEICRFSLFTWVRCCQGKALCWQVGLCRGVFLCKHTRPITAIYANTYKIIWTCRWISCNALVSCFLLYIKEKKVWIPK